MKLSPLALGLSLALYAAVGYAAAATPAPASSPAGTIERWPVTAADQRIFSGV